MNSDTWFPERLVSDSWLSSRFSILLNWGQTHASINELDQTLCLLNCGQTRSDQLSRLLEQQLSLNNNVEKKHFTSKSLSLKTCKQFSQIQGSRCHRSCWHKTCWVSEKVRKQATREPQGVSYPPTQFIPLLPSPHLNEHQRDGDEISHFWHFSVKSSMRAKIKRVSSQV